MTTPSPTSRRGMPGWAIALIVVGALALAVVCGIAALALGIVGYGKVAEQRAAAPAPPPRVLADDGPGSYACTYLDLLQKSQVGTWENVAAYQERAQTPAIRDAVDQQELDAACRAAGAPMSPR